MYTRDFGSFHTSNVQELINLPERDYVPPDIPIELPVFADYQADGEFQFGCPARRRHFYLDGTVFLNHGAFGAVLREALEAAQRWQVYIEHQPLRFYDREMLPHLVHVTRRLANFVGCDPSSLVLVPNVTTAVNCVLRSQNFQPGDRIFSLSIEYGAVKKILKQICQDTGALLQEEQVKFPLKHKQVVLDLLDAKLQADTKIAVFDHIPSNTPFIMPLKEIIDICHQKGVKVLVDGAHALGALDLDLKSLGADYYTSNCHKWFAAPKGCAFLHVAKQHQTSTRPLIISHGFGSGFTSEFIWSGLRDYSPFLALHTVIDFWEAVGPDNIRNYMHSLIKKTASMLVDKWKSRVIAPRDMFGSMCAIQLPNALYACCDDIDYNHAEAVQNLLFHRYNIEVPIKAVQGELYVRISAHIYNELEEYEKLANAILELTEENALAVPPTH